MDQASMAGPSTHPQEIQEPVSIVERPQSIFIVRPKQPFMSLSSRLQYMGITNMTTVIAKVLTPTDCQSKQSRLQLPLVSLTHWLS
jgi:hypothetical protein